MSSIDKSGKEESSPLWLIGSGASQHMAWCLDLLTNLENIVPSYVDLANDTQTSAIKSGSVVLGLGFVFHNVLYIP